MIKGNNLIVLLIMLGVFGIGFAVPAIATESGQMSQGDEEFMTQSPGTSSVNDFRKVPFTTEVLMNQDPDPAEAGKTLELRWKVTKSGEDPIENLTYNLKTEYPFSIYPGHSTIRNVGWWKGSSGKDSFYILHYKLRVHEDASQEDYQIELQKRYDDEGPWLSKKYDIRVEEAKKVNLQRGKIISEPRRLQSDMEEVKKNLEIQNIGDKNAENVKISLDLPEGFDPSYTYSDEDHLGIIPQGESRKGTFYLDIDEGLSPGRHNATLNVYYKESGETEYEQMDFPISINLKPVPEFNMVSYEPDSFSAGEEGKLKIIVENIGEKKAESVSLHAFKDLTQPFSFIERSDFIGTLSPAQKGEAIIIFDVDSDAEEKKHLLDIEIRGIYNNEVIVEQKQVRLETVKSSGEDLTPILFFGLAVAGILVAVGIYFLARKSQ